MIIRSTEPSGTHIRILPVYSHDFKSRAVTHHSNQMNQCPWMLKPMSVSDTIGCRTSEKYGRSRSSVASDNIDPEVWFFVIITYLPDGWIGATVDELRGHTMDLLRVRERRKDIHYAALSHIGETEVIPFVFESH